MSLELTAPTTLKREQKLTLGEELVVNGVPIVPYYLALEHKRDLVEDGRIGIYSIIGPILYIMSTIAVTVTSSRKRIFMSFVLAMFFVIGLQQLSAGLPDYSAIINMVLLVSLIAFFSVMMYTGFFYAVSIIRFNTGALYDLEWAMDVWFRKTIADNNDLEGIPAHLHPRINRVLSIPGVRVHVDSFLGDPLLVATRQQGLTLEEEYIGGWHTRNPAIDDV